MESVEAKENEDGTTKVYPFQLTEQTPLSIAPILIDRHSSET